MICEKCKNKCDCTTENSAQLKLNFSKVIQLEVDYDDVSELVKADIAKGDYHSLPLLDGNSTAINFATGN